MIIKDLTKREQIVLQARFEGRTLEDIGNELGLTRARVGQIEAKAEFKIKHYSSFEAINNLEHISDELKHELLLTLKSKLEEQLAILNGFDR